MDQLVEEGLFVHCDGWLSIQYHQRTIRNNHTVEGYSGWAGERKLE